MSRKSKPWRLDTHTDGEPVEEFFTTELAVFAAIPRDGSFEGAVRHWDGERWELFEVIDESWF